MQVPAKHMTCEQTKSKTKGKTKVASHAAIGMAVDGGHSGGRCTDSAMKNHEVSPAQLRQTQGAAVVSTLLV